MTRDWLRFAPEIVRLNLAKTRHRLGLRRHATGASPRPAPCQSASDSGLARDTRCEACHRFDHARLYRHVCPDLVFLGGDARCARDSADIRPYWGRAFAQLALTFASVWLALAFVFWGVLRLRGLDTLPLADVLLPARWHQIAEHRRAHFQRIALQAVAARDPATVSIALFSAAQTGRGTPESNILLARLATLGGYHSLADALHSAALDAGPRRADFAVAWHDDLLISGRPRELARLALAELARPDADREFWLRAFFEALRHPDVSADPALADPAPAYPHPGLRFAVAARAALDRGDRAAAADQLLALAGALPGQAARRFLVFSWLDAGDASRAREAAISTAHPAPPGEIAVLVHALLRAEGRDAEARAALRPLFDEPALHAAALAALVRDPDAALLHEFARRLADADPRRHAGLWLAARRAGTPDLVAAATEALARAGQPIPTELQDPGTRPATRESLTLAAALLPLDREVLHALREAR